MPKSVKQEVSTAPQTSKFCLEALRASCTELFNCSSSTFDGAMHGYQSTARFSTVEVADAIKKYKSQKI